MRILMISTVRPYAGSGSGLTDYAYQLIRHMRPLLRKDDHIDEMHALERAEKNNVAGLISTNTVFKRKIASIPVDKYDIIHITDQEMGFAAKMLKKAHNKAKIITTVHDLARFEEGLHKGFVQSTYNRLVRGSTADAIRYSDAILCNSSQTYETIRKRFPGSRNLKIVSHGIDDRFLRARAPKKHGRGVFIVGYIGALAYHKNVIFILKTANELKDDSNYRFRIYGKGPEFEALVKFKENHALNNVEFMGYVPERNKIKTYNSFDAFVFPGMYEGFGLPILEAQAMGLPVVILRNGMITSEVKRFCYVVKTPKQTMWVIKHLRTDRYTIKQKNIIIKYARKFSWKKTVKMTMQIYADCLDRNP